MVTVKYKNDCDLCGQPVEIKGFTLITQSNVYTFCCAGCQSIYNLIYINNHERVAGHGIEKSKTINKSNEDN